MINEKDTTTTLPDPDITHSRPVLSDAAKRALAEADARREQSKLAAMATEIQGRNGPEPVRYGDWEVKGLATDF